MPKKKPPATAIIVKPRPTDLTTARRAYIGGSDLAPILGISERKTRFAVWAEKVRADIKDDAENEEESAAGSYYEPFILRRFAERFNVRVVPTPKTTYHRRAAPFLAANPDGLVYRIDDAVRVIERAALVGTRPLGVVDAKTRSPFQRGVWGDAGSADVPADELCQVQWYMEVLDLPVAYLAVFFDRQLIHFVIPRDRELGALMVEEATAFWNDFVVPRVEPPFEGPAAADYLRRKYPHVTDPMKEAEAEDDILVARRLLLLQHIDVLKERLEGVNNTLRARTAAAPGIQGTGYLVRWDERKAKTTVDWRSVVTELRSFPTVPDEETARAVRAQIDAAIARHTTVGEPSRALNVYFKGPRALPHVELEPVTARQLPAATPKEDPDGNP